MIRDPTSVSTGVPRIAVDGVVGSIPTPSSLLDSFRFPSPNTTTPIPTETDVPLPETGGQIGGRETVLHRPGTSGTTVERHTVRRTGRKWDEDVRETRYFGTRKIPKRTYMSQLKTKKTMTKSLDERT